MKIEEDRPANESYITLEEAVKVVKHPEDEIPFPKAQPERFTVHACADPGKMTKIVLLKVFHSDYFR